MSNIHRQLENARIALTNAGNTHDLQTRLVLFGYGTERLQEGIHLYETALALVQQEVDVRAGKVATTAAFRLALKQAQLHYHHDLRAARLALKERPEAQHSLQLQGTRHYLFTGWLKQARQFYGGLKDNPTLLGLVATYGVNLARVTEGLAALQTVEASLAAQRKGVSDSKTMLRQRNQALKALVQWMKIFKGVARAALHSTPEQLAALGLGQSPQRRNDKVVVEPAPPAVVMEKSTNESYLAQSI